MKITKIFPLVLFLLGVWTPAAFSQSSEELKDLRRDIDAVRDGLKVIQNELAEIKKLLQQQPPAAPQPFQEATINIAGAPFLGEKSAKVTLVEFSDYQCPFSARNFQETFAQVVSEYVKTGRLKYVFRDFPLESLHPFALKASVAARCAGEQGKYWEMHDKLFANQNALAADNLVAYAKEVGVDTGKFKACMDSDPPVNKVRADVTEGNRIGARGTPGFFLGLTQPDQPVFKAVKYIDGAQPFANFKDAIDQLLAAR